jgi:SAM-dependent methyltransferase
MIGSARRDHGGGHDQRAGPDHGTPRSIAPHDNGTGPTPPLAFEPGDEDEWHRLSRGYRLAGLLISAHRMGLLQVLSADRSHTSDELAAQLLADRKLLVDICRALRAAGLLVADDGGWRLSQAGARLAGDHAASLELDAMADDYRRWGELDRHARQLREDGRTEPSAHGDDDVAHNQQAARRYTRRMSNRRRMQAQRLVGRVQPTRPVTVLDAWGGDGYAAREVCASWPESICTVLEVPAAAEIAREACAGHPRIAVVTGDLLLDDPGAVLGGEQIDVVILSHVLQSLPQHRRRELSAQVARLLAPGGCVLSSEFVLRWDDRDSLNVLLWAVGRTAANWRADPLRATEQDLLLRGSGLAAVGSWWVTQSTRAVLGVRTAAGVEPALRLRPA